MDLPADALQLEDDLGDPALRMWRRSSRCGSHGACVEISDIAGGSVAVRDGKIPATSPVLVFGAEDWRSFLAAVTAGELG